MTPPSTPQPPDSTFDIALKHLRARHAAQDIAFFAAHYNGYLREAAMLHCVTLNDPHLLPVVASRLNDWVGQVRDAARSGVMALAAVCSSMQLLAILPAVLRLHAARRTDHADWIRQFESMLATRLSHADIAAGIAASDLALSRACFHFARRHRLASHAQLIILALAQRRDILMAQWALVLISGLPAAERLDWYRQLAVSHFLLLRVASLQGRLDLDPAAADALALAALRDDAATMRDSAIRYLQRRAIDVRGIYRNLLQDQATGPRLVRVALVALSGLNDQQDVALIEPFMQAASPAVREAALAAVLRLAPARKDEIAIAALRDAAPRLRRFALQVVRKHRAYIPLEQARTILLYLHDYGRLLQCMQADRWQWLEVLVELAERPKPDAELTALLRASAIQWQRVAGNHYTAPAPRQAALFATPTSMRALQELGIAPSWLHPF